MDRNSIFAVVAVFAAVLVGTSLMAWGRLQRPTEPNEPVETKSAPLKQADRAQLQQMATEACQCELDTPGKDCRAAYEQASKPFRNSKGPTWATACAPISTEGERLIDAAGEFNITLGYSIVGGQLVDRRLCKKEDAQFVEAAFSKAIRAAPAKHIQDLARAHDEANRALGNAVAQLRKGKVPLTAPNSEGCT